MPTQPIATAALPTTPLASPDCLNLCIRPCNRPSGMQNCGTQTFPSSMTRNGKFSFWMRQLQLAAIIFSLTLGLLANASVAFGAESPSSNDSSPQYSATSDNPL